MIEIIPVPITFNPYKHHFKFLEKKIREWKSHDWVATKSKIQKMGSNLLDFYYGELTIGEICEECIAFFQQKKIIEKNQFLEWLKPADYRKIKLSDQSVWIVKEGTDSNRYIHIHPAKNSPHAMRIRATTLKTVVACRIVFNSEAEYKITLEEVNQIRTEYLDLSPVKSIQPGKGIYKIWHIFSSL